MAKSESSVITPTGHGTGETEGDKSPRSFIPRAEAHNKAWLSWKSDDCLHGLKKHHVNANGTIREIEDAEPALEREKPKGISSRQWNRSE